MVKSSVVKYFKFNKYYQINKFIIIKLSIAKGINILFNLQKNKWFVLIDFLCKDFNLRILIP